MLRYISILLFSVCLPWTAAALEMQVNVSEKGKDATEARMKALSAADLAAFTQLVRERAPERAEAMLKAYPLEAISQMVQGYEIVEESMTPNSYRATMKVKLDDSALSKIPYLGGSGKGSAAAPAAVLESEAVLIMPVWFDNTGIRLWEAENPWRDALSKAALQAGGKWIMPAGDPSDLIIIDSSTVSSADFTKLAPLAARYGAGRILVATAKPGIATLAVELRRLSAAGEEKENIKFTSGASEATQEQILQRAAEELLLGDSPSALDTHQKQEKPKKPQLHEINALLNLTRARDWAELNHRLRSIPGVETLQVVNADWQRMQVKLVYRGFPEDLGTSFAKAGLNVQQQGDMLLLTIR